MLLLLCGSGLRAQQTDSLRINLQQAETIFLQKNLLLLAQQYQVNAAKAGEIQAGLFANPNFSADLALKGQNRPWFDLGVNGQKAFAVEQLIELAGKRNKRVLLARNNTQQANLALYDLMRTLRFQLRQSFYSLAFSQKLIQQLNRQSDRLENIVNAYETQTEKRNVSGKDLVRLKTELIQLNSERNDVVNDAIDAQQQLQLLLDTTAALIPDVNVDELRQHDAGAPGLLEKALASRSDLKLQQAAVEQANLNFNYQKALAKPDLTLGLGYDQNGSYTPHFFNLHAAVDLPFFNRNQGNIKMAEADKQIAAAGLSYKQSSIQNELATAITRIRQLDKEYNLVQENFDKDYSTINRGIIENFNKGNVSLLEFLDFFESYNSAIQVINQLNKQRALANEALEFIVGAAL